MRFAELVAASDAATGTRGRKAKVEALADLLARLRGLEVPVGVHFLCGDLRQGRIGLGPALVQSLPRPAPSAEPTLELLEIDEAFARLATISGAGSKAARVALLGALVARATAAEQDFLRRLMVGELRQGALEGVLAEAVARASDLPAGDVRRAAMLGGRLADVAVAALEEGASGLTRFRLELLRPVQPMLAGSAADPSQALERLGRAAFEWKLDGARIQVHRRGDQVRVFTRKLHEVSARVPEVVSAVLSLPERELVLDGEVLALTAAGRPHPFQVSMRRFGRSQDVERVRAELPLSPFFFDVLHAGGEDWLDRPAADRFEVLSQLVPEVWRVPRLATADAEEADAFLDAALARGHEGVLAKALDAPYEAGRRGARWLKIKLAQTLDLVVIAAEWGSGRRSGWLSNLHLAARDARGDLGGGFVMLGKTFKGMNDQILVWQTARLLELARERSEHVVQVAPELVVEIAFDGVQESPQYPGGVALRFARLVRYRPDKTPLEADTIDGVRALLPR